MLPFELTKDTPYLALSGELWSVFYEYFNRNRPCYKGFLLFYFSYAISRDNNIHRDLLCLDTQAMVASVPTGTTDEMLVLGI